MESNGLHERTSFTKFGLAHKNWHFSCKNDETMWNLCNFQSCPLLSGCKIAINKTLFGHHKCTTIMTVVPMFINVWKVFKTMVIYTMKFGVFGMWVSSLIECIVAFLSPIGLLAYFYGSWNLSTKLIRINHGTNLNWGLVWLEDMGWG